MTSTKKKKKHPLLKHALSCLKKTNTGQIIAVVAPSKHSQRTALALPILNLWTKAPEEATLWSGDTSIHQGFHSREVQYWWIPLFWQKLGCLKWTMGHVSLDDVWKVSLPIWPPPPYNCVEVMERAQFVCHVGNQKWARRRDKLEFNIQNHQQELIGRLCVLRR